MIPAGARPGGGFSDLGSKEGVIGLGVDGGFKKYVSVFLQQAWSKSIFWAYLRTLSRLTGRPWPAWNGLDYSEI